MRYACQEKLLHGSTDDERIAHARESGFEGIEINASFEPPLARRAEELASALERHGCSVAAVCGGYRGWLGHFDAASRALAVQDITGLLAVAAALKAPGLVVPAAYGMFSRKLPPHTPPRSEADDRVALLAALRAVAVAAERRGVRIFLEPLNRYEDHMLNTLAQARDISAALGSLAVVPMIDLFHAGIEERDIPESIRAAGAVPAHVHLADSNRLEPGQGHLEYGPIFGALRDVGFQGWCALECSLSTPDRGTLKRSLEFLRRAEGGASG